MGSEKTSLFLTIIFFLTTISGSNGDGDLITSELGTPFSYCAKNLKNNAGYFPWNVLLKRIKALSDSVFCYGTLLPSSKYNESSLIITAKSCFPKIPKNINSFRVLAGIGTYNGLQSIGNEYKISEIHSFEKADPKWDDSFVFMKTRKPIAYSDTVMPICLPCNSMENHFMETDHCFIPESRDGFFLVERKIKKSHPSLTKPTVCNEILNLTLDQETEYCALSTTITATGGATSMLRTGGAVACYSSSDRWEIRGIVTSGQVVMNLNSAKEVDAAVCKKLHPSLAADRITTTANFWNDQTELAEQFYAKVSIAQKGRRGNAEPVKTTEVTVKRTSASRAFSPTWKTVNGVTALRSPWFVLIVDLGSHPPKLVCGGSILDSSTTGTAFDRIVTTPNCHPLTSEHYVISVDKYSRNEISADLVKALPTVRQIDFATLLTLEQKGSDGKKLGINVLKLKTPYLLEQNRQMPAASSLNDCQDEPKDCYLSGMDGEGRTMQMSVRLAEECHLKVPDDDDHEVTICAYRPSNVTFEAPAGSPLVCRLPDGWLQHGILQEPLTAEDNDSTVIRLTKLAPFRMALVGDGMLRP